MSIKKLSMDKEGRKQAAHSLRIWADWIEEDILPVSVSRMTNYDSSTEDFELRLLISLGSRLGGRAKSLLPFTHPANNLFGFNAERDQLNGIPVFRSSNIVGDKR